MTNSSQQLQDLTVDEIELALSHIDPNTDRDEWARLGMAIKSELGESGFEVWDAWSRRADNYIQRDAKDTWRSIKASGGVGIATLVHVAKRNGYRQDNSPPKQVDAQAAAERRARREADARREAEETERRNARAAADAVAMWEAASPLAHHDYIERKAILSPGNVRVGIYRRWVDDGMVEIPEALLIPLRDAGGKIASLQAIFPDDDNALGRDRDYLPGGRKQGCYFNIGKPTGKPDELVMIGEGYATVASAHTACGGVGVVAFDSGNLCEVAQIIRTKLPAARIVLLADNDRFGKRNTGILKATEAAKLVNGLVAIPQFASDDGQPTDFNDLQTRQGTAVVRAQIEAAAAPETPEPSAANDNNPAPSSFEWSTPLDVFGIHQPPVLPMDVMPTPFQAYIADQAQLLGCDPAIIGIGLIVAAAAATTDDVKLQPKRKDPGWLEHPRVWAAIVGDPSTRKSPAISKAVRFIKRIDHALAVDNSSAYADYKAQHESWKEAKKADKTLPEPKQPPNRRMVVEDITVEALTEVLKDNPRGVLTLKDELTGWFASMDAYKGGGKGASMDRAHWLEAYNGDRHIVDRVTRGQVVVPNWSTCILGGIQPDMMRSIAKSMGNDGLLQRFMIVCARPSVESVDEYPDFNAMDKVEAIFGHLASIQASGEKPVMLTEQAHENRLRVTGYAHRLVAALDSPHMKAWLGKWDGLFARLCIIYHAIECADQHIHPCSQPVPAAIAEKVERLMCGFLLHHALHFYNEIVDANDRQDHVRQLAKLILARKFARITKRDITLYWKASQRMEWWQVRSVIDVLCTMGWLEPDTGAIDMDGKPRSWHVNPAVHTGFHEHAEQERARRQDASKMLKELFTAYNE